MTDREDVLVYDRSRDLEQVLHNIVNLWKRNDEYKKRWNISPKEEVWVNIKVQGDFVELRVECLKGGWRESRLDIQEMPRFAKEVKKMLDKAEKDLRKDFKEVTGKALRWTKPETKVNYEPMALNALVKFYACKSGRVTTSVDRQEFDEKGPKISTGKKGKKKEDESLFDLIKLPERWR